MAYTYDIVIFYVNKGEKTVNQWNIKMTFRKGKYTFAQLDTMVEDISKKKFRIRRYFDKRDYAIVGVKMKRKLVFRLKKEK